MGANGLNLVEDPPQGFLSASARFRYLVLCICTFSIFLTQSAGSVLAKVFEDAGYSDFLVGASLAVSGVSTILGLLISGPLTRRFGVLGTVKLGSACLLLSFLSLIWTVSHPVALFSSRLAQGFAYGIFLAPAMLYAKKQLTKSRFVTLFGIYASMIPLPNVLGPALAAWISEAFDRQSFFLITALPMIAGVIGLLVVRGDVQPNKDSGVLSYGMVLSRREVVHVLMAVYGVGLIFGIVPSYLAVYILERGGDVGSFFTVFALALFGSRFVIAPLIEQLEGGQIVAAGALLMGIAYVTASLSVTPVLCAMAGLVFGLGYSVCYPRLSVMSVLPFDEHDRERPIALFNCCFVAGTSTTPYLIGAFGGTDAVRGFLLAGGLLSALLASMFLLRVAVKGSAGTP